MATTLRDVAAKLNLSPSLVSGVLNNRAGIWASEETRRRIMDAARELNYRPNAAARALRSGKSRSVAFVQYKSAQQARSSDQNGVIETFAELLGEQDFDLIVKIASNHHRMTASLANLVHTRSCDAVILWGSEEDQEEQGIFLERLGMPFVVKGRHELTHPEWPQVDFDHEDMMAQSVRHLASLGHRRIASFRHSDTGAYNERLLQGYRAAMRDLLGRPVRDDFVSCSAGNPEMVQEQLAAWAALPPDERPTAIANGAGNAVWQGVEMFLAREGKFAGDEPGEFSVAGASHANLCLIFGHGHCFKDIKLWDLAEAAVEHLLPAVLAGEKPKQPILRVRPTLHPINTLELTKFGQFVPRPAS